MSMVPFSREGGGGGILKANPPLLESCLIYCVAGNSNRSKVKMISALRFKKMWIADFKRRLGHEL